MEAGQRVRDVVEAAQTHSALTEFAGPSRPAGHPGGYCHSSPNELAQG